ncbi:MAG TPA: hypothetical protein VHQ03_00680 [Candidatus Dormibacteraeota bacterium]|nr:hypothetical protein [Candidatus Dormibacteraeota bacterium]
MAASGPDRASEPVTATGVRVPGARLIVILAVLIVCSAILWMTRTYSFYLDEWDFILTAPDWTPATLLQPHNEHPVVLTRLIYYVLLVTVGLHTYWPFMTALLTAHAATVILVFEIVRRRAGDLIGLACASLLLALGAGWEDLLWAFQIAFVGAVAFGLGAMLAFESAVTARDKAIAVALLAASVMFSGIGLFFAVTTAVRLAADRRRWLDLAWLMPLGVAIGGWYLRFGRSGGPGAPGIQLSNLLALPAYTVWGLAGSAGGLIGVGGWGALGVLALAAVALVLTWRRHRPDALAIGVAAGLIAFYAITGLTRAQIGYVQSGAGRYVYVGAVFWLILLADAARHLPWRGTWRPALVACAFLACFSSAVLLFTFGYAKAIQMERQTADLQALAYELGDPCLNPSGAVDPQVMPWVSRPALYYRAIADYGDPVAGTLVTDAADFNAALRNLRRAGC